MFHDKSAFVVPAKLCETPFSQPSVGAFASSRNRQPRNNSLPAARTVSLALPSRPLDNNPIENVLQTDWRHYRAHLLASHRTHRNPFIHRLLRQQTIDHVLLHRVTQDNFGKEFKTKTMFWAHPLANIELGACLISSPAFDWPEVSSHFQKSVILVTSISTTEVKGILLNRPTKFCIGANSKALIQAGPQFSENRIMQGGFKNSGTLEILHAFSESACDGCESLMPGLSRGGMTTARALVASGLAIANEFHFFMSSFKWTTSSLHEELDRGAWNIIACSPELLLVNDAHQHPDWLWNSLHAFT